MSNDRITLGAVNLNLLPALEALLSERNVSAAARRFGVSQSAMSHSLAKLRDLLDDPLLVVSGRAMEMTPRGEALARALPAALNALRSALTGPGAFDPSAAERQFRIATFDYFEFTTLPDTLDYLRQHAPGIRLDIVRLDAAAIKALTRGEFDLAIAGESMSMPSVLMQRLLFRDPFATIARCDHPRICDELSLDDYLAEDHVLISVEGRGSGLVDRQLAKLERSRRVSLRVPHFSTAPLAVAHSDMICTLSRTVAQRAHELYGVRVIEPPIDLPSAGVVAWWARQHHTDPARRWFRGIIADGLAVSPELRAMMSNPTDRET